MVSLSWLLCRLTFLLIIIALTLCYVARFDFTPLAYSTSVEIGKYWLIEHLGEQLGKAKFHLLEQIAITILLNRTLVLPNVGNSEIGLRLTKPFEYYYRTDGLTNLVRTLSTTEFNSYMMNIDIRRSLKACLVFIGTSSCPAKKFTWNSVQSTTFKNLLNKFDLKKLRPLCFLTSHGSELPALPYIMAKQLTNIHNNVDIIVAIKESPWFLMDPNKLPVHVLEHSWTLIKMAKDFAKAASPYLAIHWRMEGSKKDGRLCARTLLQTVSNISSMHYFKKIYFSTDRPLSSNQLISNSYRKSRIDQTLGYNEVMKKLKPLTFRNISSYPAIGGSSTLSIIEKLICRESEFFLAGYAPCDRNGAYGREIVKYRQLISRKPWLYWTNPAQPYDPEKYFPI